MGMHCGNNANAQVEGSLCNPFGSVLHANANGGGVEERNNYHIFWFYLHLVAVGYIGFASFKP